MHFEKKLAFDQLLTQLSGLSDHQRRQLKAELDRLETHAIDDSLEEFLLSAPTFSENQIKKIEETRKAIDQWRKN